MLCSCTGVLTPVVGITDVFQQGCWLPVSCPEKQRHVTHSASPHSCTSCLYAQVLLDYLHLLSIVCCSTAAMLWPRSLWNFTAAFTFVPLGTSKWVNLDCLLPADWSIPKSMLNLMITALVPGNACIPALGYASVVCMYTVASGGMSCITCIAQVLTQQKTTAR